MNFLNNITNYISKIEDESIQKFRNIYNTFLADFNSDITRYINKQYLADLEYNYTNCLNYSIDLLNETLKEDKINYDLYI